MKHLRLSAPPSGLPEGPGQWTLARTAVAGSSPLYCRHQDGSSNSGPPSHHLASISIRRSLHLPSLSTPPPPTAPSCPPWLLARNSAPSRSATRLGKTCCISSKVYVQPPSPPLCPASLTLALCAAASAHTWLYLGPRKEERRP